MRCVGVYQVKPVIGQVALFQANYVPCLGGML
jgi:hypothetical protein